MAEGGEGGGGGEGKTLPSVDHVPLRGVVVKMVFTFGLGGEGENLKPKDKKFHYLFKTFHYVRNQRSHKRSNHCY